jgi:hypothetical protein
MTINRVNRKSGPTCARWRRGKGPLGPEARLSFAKSLQQAKYLAWDLNYAGTYALKTGAAMGLLSKQAASEPEPICYPITTPRADALRRVNAPLGEP